MNLKLVMYDVDKQEHLSCYCKCGTLLKTILQGLHVRTSLLLSCCKPFHEKRPQRVVKSSWLTFITGLVFSVNMFGASIMPSLSAIMVLRGRKCD